MLGPDPTPLPLPQAFIDWVNSYILTGTISGILLTSLASAFFLSLFPRFFLRRNTKIQQEIQADYARVLAAQKVESDQRLIDYKQHVDHQLMAKVESLRASLSRDNIGYQLTQAEYIKRQFTYAEEIYGLIYQYHRLIVNGFNWSLKDPNKRTTLEDEVQKNRKDLYEKYLPGSLFLTDKVIKAVEDYESAAFDFIVSHETMIEDKEYKKDTSLSSDEKTELWNLSRESMKKYSDSKKALVDQFISLTGEMKRLSRSHIVQ